jgi:hypothetical protein
VKGWLADPNLRHIGLLVSLEFTLALDSDLVGRDEPR